MRVAVYVLYFRMSGCLLSWCNLSNDLAASGRRWCADLWHVNHSFVTFHFTSCCVFHSAKLHVCYAYGCLCSMRST